MEERDQDNSVAQLRGIFAGLIDEQRDDTILHCFPSDLLHHPGEIDGVAFEEVRSRLGMEDLVGHPSSLLLEPLSVATAHPPAHGELPQTRFDGSLLALGMRQSPGHDGSSPTRDLDEPLALQFLQCAGSRTG
jgi:hypothetical protein